MPEKLVLMNAEAERLAADDQATPRRNIGRHFYDIHELLGDADVQQLLSDGQEAARIVSEVQAIWTQHFGIVDAEVRPAGGRRLVGVSFGHDCIGQASRGVRVNNAGAVLWIRCSTQLEAICTRVAASRSQL